MSDTKPESQNIDTKAEPVSVPRPSPNGIRSIQGEVPPGFPSIEGLYLTDLDAGNVGKVYAKDFLKDVPQLTRSAANELNLAAQHAESTKATRGHAENPNGIRSEYWRTRSEISEHVAQANMPNSIRTDPLSESGTNFPGYDLTNQDEICSVKAFTLRSSTKDEQASPRYGAYRSEFQDIISPTSDQNQKAANRFWKLKSEEGWNDIAKHLPPEVASANNPEEMAEAISNYSTMRIPEDQMEDVRNNIMKKCGVSREEVCSRVKSIDPEYTTAHYQAKAAELRMKRQEEYIALQERLRLRGNA